MSSSSLRNLLPDSDAMGRAVEVSSSILKVASSDSVEDPAVCVEPSFDVEPSVVSVEISTADVEVPGPSVEAFEEDSTPVVEPSSPLHMHVPFAAVVPVVEVREL